jgi:peptidoglycan/LPS O-acetylase OafA/YrhL
MHYRADINGLRAVAVIPVVLYHAGFSTISGGFVGVDIFFVISGFLITSDIIERIDKGEFSLVDFYHRRVRRIFPALFVMLAGCFLMAWFVLPPGEMVPFAKSAIATALSSANIYFYRNTDYFTEAAMSLPLLHTWSLAVEEQFYLLWPLALILLMRRARPWSLIAVAGLSVLSLYSAQRILPVSQPFAFYMLPARAWELLLGGLLAMPMIRNARLGQMPAELLSACGLALVLGALFLIDSGTPFPGLAALAPCLGAALIIAAGIHYQPAISKALSVLPATFVGLISYSLYLWHWPLLVFAGIYANRQLYLSERVGVVMLALVVSALSWRFVERPFRRQASGWKWVGPAFLTMGAVGLLSLIVVKSSGFPGRGPDGGPIVKAAMAESATFQASNCLIRDAVVMDCFLGSKGGPARVALWGDSHAAHLAPLLDKIGSALGLRIRQLTKRGCAPLGDLVASPPSEMRHDCPEFNASALKAILADPNISTVVLAAEWRAYTRGDLIVAKAGEWPSLDVSRRNIATQLRETASILAARAIKMIVVGPAPDPRINVVDCLNRAHFLGASDANCASTFSSASWRDEDQWSLLVSGSTEFSELSIMGALCGRDACSLIDDTGILYLDNNHLSSAGAQRLLPLFRAALTSAVADAVSSPKQKTLP